MATGDDSRPRGLLARLFGGLSAPERISGPPTSSNGASSMHLIWESPPRPVREVSVVIEIPVAPKVDQLYFWALQAGFRRRGSPSLGAGHIGLQWHPSYPESTAANWGGYATGGGELGGSPLAMPSALGNANTGDYRWLPAHRYRLSIGPWHADDGPTGSWPGAITDLASGDRVEIRRLFAGGPELGDISMWSEVFARCDDPSVAVRWSDPTWVFDDGSLGWPGSARVNYQTRADGGCDNTDCSSDGEGLVQVTNATRATPAGTHLVVPDSLI